MVHNDQGHEVALGALIQRRRIAMRLSLAEVARRADCAKSYLSAIENGTRGAPGEELAQRLERVLSFRDNELVEQSRWARTPKSVREDVEALRARDAVGREIAALLKDNTNNSLDALHQSGRLEQLIKAFEGNTDSDPQPSPPPTTLARGIAPIEIPIEIPLINKVTAGYPASFTDLGYPARVADEYIRAPDVHDPDAFAARVIGDSMEPQYKEGDVVVFSPSKPVESGMDCFVRLEPDHESTFKRVYFEENEHGEEVIRIQPMNNAYRPIVVARDQVAGLYAGVSVIRSI